MSYCSKSLSRQYSKSNWISNWNANRTTCGVPLMALRSITSCYYFHSSFNWNDSFNWIESSIRKGISAIQPVWFLWIKRNLCIHLSGLPLAIADFERNAKTNHIWKHRLVHGRSVSSACIFDRFYSPKRPHCLSNALFGCWFIAMDYCHERILINWYYLHSAFNGAVPYRNLFLFLLSRATNAVRTDWNYL